MGDRRRVREFLGKRVEVPDDLAYLMDDWIAADASGSLQEHLETLALIGSGDPSVPIAPIFDVDPKAMSDWVEGGCATPLTFRSARWITTVAAPSSSSAAFRIVNAALAGDVDGDGEYDFQAEDLTKFRELASDQITGDFPMSPSAAAVMNSIEFTEQGDVVRILMAAFLLACSMSGHRVAGHRVDCQGLDGLVDKITFALRAGAGPRPLIVSSLGIAATFVLSLRDSVLPFELTEIDVRQI
jgi:hypothetical protein